MSFSHALPLVSNSDDECDISGLLEAFDAIPDPRSPRGRIYGMTFLLAASLIAVLAGAKTFAAIGRQVGDLSSSMLAKLGCAWCYFQRDFRLPDEKTIRMLLARVDADELDRVFGAWLFRNVRRDDGALLVLSIDGKVLRGAWTDENENFTLFSAMIHGAGVTVAQVAVPGDTNEITQVEELLDRLPIDPGQPVLVTMDAAHTQRDTAEYIKGKRGFDYVVTIKGNQPTLQRTVAAAMVPVLRETPEFSVKERGHGRVNQWRTWTRDADGVTFPHVERLACIRRDTHTLDGVWISKEIALIATSKPDMTAEEFHTHVRNHWGIENKSHYVRDTVWREDLHQARTGNGPRNMATLRNAAISVFRIGGHNNITEATERVARDRTRTLPLLATRRHR